jgi:hypothetical protein
LASFCIIEFSMTPFPAYLETFCIPSEE